MELHWVSISLALTLSLSLGSHVWNHLVSQKAWRNGKEDKCNARSAKRGERGRRQRENMNNYVQCLQLEELSSESEPTSAPRPQFGGSNRPKMPPKGSLGDPLDAPWTALGSSRGSVGRSGGSWDAVWRSSGALWSSSGAPWELWGVILELSGTILEAFWNDFRDLFLSLLRVLWKPASSSVLVVLGTFCLTSFAKFAKWQGSFPLDNY